MALFHARRLNDIRLVSAIAGPRCYIVRVVHDDFVALRLPVSAIKFNLYRHRFSDTGAVVVKKYKKKQLKIVCVVGRQRGQNRYCAQHTHEIDRN